MKRAGLDAYEVGGELALTQEETTETIVPDYCPDIARIIETEGKVFLHSRELRDGKAEVSGTIRVTVLYTPDGESGIRTLEFAPKGFYPLQAGDTSHRLSAITAGLLYRCRGRKRALRREAAGAAARHSVDAHC